MEKHNETAKKPLNKIIITICLMSAALIIGIWVWKSAEIANIKKQSAAEIKLLKENIYTKMRKSDELHLRAIAKPLVWAVRSELLKNNLSQVNLYANEMVKEKNFQKIVVTNDKGVAILSTNKKDEGKIFTSGGKINYLATDTTSIENSNDSLLIMTSPVMGFNNRLGTVIVTYSIDHPELK